MKIKKIINGIFALLMAGSVLLFSDLSNRNDSKDRESTQQRDAGLMANKGEKYKIGLSYFAPEESFDNLLKGLWKGMAELGFVKDSNLTVISQHANGEIANLNPIHLNLDNQDVDAILVTSTPGITAALAAAKKHPLVFTYSYTPLEAGAGKSFTDHLPNITGVGSFPPVKKTIDFICESIPHTKRIGTLYNSSEANSRKVVQIAREYTEDIGIDLMENTVTNTSEVHQAISALCMRNVDAIWITGDNTAIQAFQSIVKVCDDNEIPLIINDSDYVERGALAAVGISWRATGYRTAKYLARVLNGESPANIPIENYVKEEIIINKKLAEKLNIKFPSKYLNETQAILKGKNYKFCLAHYVDSPNSEDAEQGIRDELKKSGLEEGTDFTLKVLNAQGDISTLNSIADAIAADKWDIVFVTSTPTIQAISNKISNSPIVFTNVGDPVRAGLGESFQHHLPNLTGVSTMSDFKGLITMVKESIPGIKTVGTIYTPGEVNSVAYKEALDKEATKQGLSLIAVPANSASEVADAALSIASRGIEAFTQISDNLTASCGASIIKVAYSHQIPYFAFISNQVNDGAVAAIARDYYFAGVDAVNMAKEVLNGKSPKDIPFRFVTKSNVSVNSKAETFFKCKVPDAYNTDDQSSSDNVPKEIIDKTDDLSVNPTIHKPFDRPQKIALVHYAASRDCEDVETGILQRLQETGHVENSDFTFDVYNANADIATLNTIVLVVADKNYDLIFSTVLASTQALASKIKDVPILFTVVGDPVGNGLGHSYTKHISNVTGIDGSSYADRGVLLVQKYLPRAQRFGVLFPPGEAAALSELKALKKACIKNQIELIALPVNTVGEIADATELLCAKNVDAICQIPDNISIPGFASMVKTSKKRGVPLFCFITSQVEMGAVAAIAGNFTQQGSEIADIALRVINGTSPNDIPFSRIKQILTVINPEAAKAYGLETPDAVYNIAQKIVGENQKK